MTGEHGTRYRYMRGCRCTACTTASRGYHAARRQLAMRRRTVDHQLRDVAPVASALHGRLGTYTNHGCRCEECCAARLDYSRHSVSVLPEETPGGTP